MKTMKRFLSMLLMFMLILQCAPIAFAEGETAVTLSSDVNGLIGVPVNAKIPLTFSADVEVTESDVTVSPADDFELEGSGASYAINFTEDMKYGTVYTVSTSYGTISYTTAYGTDVAKIDYGTFSGSWKSATFGKDLSELTLKITFSELTTSKGVWLANDNSYVSKVLIDTLAGTNLMKLNGYWYDSAGEHSIGANITNVAVTDTVYVTYKNKTMYMFKVASDGTVTCGTSASYAEYSTAEKTVNEMRITSAVTCVSVGDTVTPNADDGNTDGEYVEVNCTATSTINGLPGVPVEAKIPVTLSESIGLKSSNVKVTYGGNEVNNVTVSGSGTDYTLSFEKDYNTAYSIQIGTGDPITFTTAYGTDVAQMNYGSYSGSYKSAKFGKDLYEMTLKITFNSLTNSAGVWLANDNSYVSKVLIDTLAGTNLMKLNGYWYDSAGEHSIGANITNVAVTDTVYVTYKNKTMYMFKVAEDGTVTRGTNASYASYATSENTFDEMRTLSTVTCVSVGGIEKPSASEISITNADAGNIAVSYAFTTSATRKIICAVYDVSEEVPVLLDAEVKTVSDIIGTLTFTLDTKSKTNLKYKLFALNNLDDVTPLTKADEYPAN